MKVINSVISAHQQQVLLKNTYCINAILVLEFGVANGTGLLNICEIS